MCFKLHGWLRSIVCDRDTVFISKFWQSLFTIQGTDMQLSSAYRPQTDGQTEVINRCLENYLRCMVLDSPWNWSCWLPLAEWWYNTNFHSSAQLTPFEIVYNQPPPVHMPYLPGETNVVVDRSLKKREEMIRILKLNLANAQNRMKQYADHHRSDRSFSIGDWV